jgi:hypothetical protein
VESCNFLSTITFLNRTEFSFFDLFENVFANLFSFAFLDSLVNLVLKLLMVVMSGVQWCGSHFLIERCTDMELLQICSSTQNFNIPCWCRCSVGLLCKIAGVA